MSVSELVLKLEKGGYLINDFVPNGLVYIISKISDINNAYKVVIIEQYEKIIPNISHELRLHESNASISIKYATIEELEKNYLTSENYREVEKSVVDEFINKKIDLLKNKVQI